METIYLDYASTTNLDERVLECMLPMLTKHFGNASSTTHSYGWQAAELVEVAREKVANAIGAAPREIIFTSGATESNNLALKGVAFHLAASRTPDLCNIVSCSTEHKSVLDPLRYLKLLGLSVSLAEVDCQGNIDTTELNAMCGDNCDLLSLMHVNNETGIIHDIEAIVGSSLINFGKSGRSSRPLVHCDATQSLGKLPIDVRKLPVDMLSISSHKIYGPKGAGALYLKNSELAPLLHGGGQEYGMRGGTLNTAAIVGFGEACRLASMELVRNQEHTKRLSELFMELLTTRIDNVEINGSVQNRLYGILNIFIPGLNQAYLFGKIGARLAVSAGSACSSGSGEPSHVLRSMGLSDERIRSSIRVSFGRGTTEEEVAGAVELIATNLNSNEKKQLINSAT